MRYFYELLAESPELLNTFEKIEERLKTAGFTLIDATQAVLILPDKPEADGQQAANAEGGRE